MKVSSGSVTTSEPALRRVPQQARSRALIQRVLDSAEELLASEGVEALTTTRIAGEANVAVGSLYQYYPDKRAIVDALAARYLDEFEGLMDEMAERAAGERWRADDLVDRLIDAYADRYRREPGYRALWFGRHLSEELRQADRQNKAALAEGVRRILTGTREVRDSKGLRTACFAAVLTADALLVEAFQQDPEGEPALLGEAKRILRCHLADVVSRYSRTGSRRR
jgi:AcrR family transcriptional regulator